MESYPKIASVLLDLGIDYPLDYGVLESQLDQAYPGMRVHVPVRGHLRSGMILDVKERPSTPHILPIAELLPESSLPADLFELALWMEKYYLTPARKILKTFLPTQVRVNNYNPQTQAFVTRAVSQDQLRLACQELRHSSAIQAKVLDCLLLNDKGLFLADLLELTGVSRSPVQTLAEKKLLHIQNVCIDRSPLIGEEYFKTKPKSLNEEQLQAVNAFCASLSQQEFATYLLHGVTGSGKTEVYLQTIERALSLGRSTIMLVPEISLTEQTIQRFRGRFENHIAILHHRLSQGERHDQWHRIRRGEAKIVIGARSALFSPVQNLGLIIVDEEHDAAYKQSEERPTYHARDMAVVRGKLTQSVVILGSATPSIESYHNAQRGKYRLFTLTSRATTSQLPAVTIVDMRKEYERNHGYTSFSQLLIDKMKQRLAQGEQTIIFLNRRGYHTSMQCLGCGYIFKCPHCDLAMTFHLGQQKLCCHLCGHMLCPPPKLCPSCKVSEDLKFRGVGTEQIQKALHALLPDVRTLRIDGDTTRHKGSHDKLLREFRTGKADILIGTQMIAKGLHFPSVTLVAVLNADSSLNIPDFRASEQTFQLITQVAGRAGRGELAGEVILQTQLPDNAIIQVAAEQDYLKFYSQELETRRLFNFPPFIHLAKCTFSGLDAVLTEQVCLEFRKKLITKLSRSAHVHPVGPSGYARVKDLYRFQFLIRAPSMREVGAAISQLSVPKQVKLHVDLDALSTFF
ncbi:MAG: primosomal protein N' [Verrucomicrobia bacterium]|nr:primosomal protein N' [Verrucomicrobiota bacterium]MBS0645068.1 primosomal protein N' [Verrucomicrobiota bacterium]